MSATRYTARATREGRWWVLEVDGIGATQVRTLSRARAQARDMVSAMLDVQPDEIEVEVVPALDERTRERVAHARRAQAEAEAKQREAALEQRQVVSMLREQGLSGRDVAKVLGVSPQRVSQLTKSSKGEASRVRSRTVGA